MLAQEGVGPFDFGHVGIARDTECKNELLGSQHHLFALALHHHGPFPLGLIEGRFLGQGGAPVVDLHHLGVHLQPVAELVFGREHGPVVWERHVGQVVVPDRVVQTQGFVAVAPAVARLRVLFDHDGGHAKAFEPRGQNNAALATADDHHIGLLLVTQARLFRFAPLQPALAALLRAMLGTFDAVGAGFFFETFQLGHGGQQRPGFVVFEAQLAAPARQACLEGEPGFCHTVGLGGLAFKLEIRGAGFGHARRKHVAHRIQALLRADVPGEGHEIAPVTIGVEQRHHGVGLVRGLRGPKLVHPALRALGGGGVGHGCCLL